MLADFFTKPLQGTLFVTFRDVILGYKHVDSLLSAPTTAPEERVGMERTDDAGTERATANVPEEDGFTLVTGKKKYARAVEDAANRSTVIVRPAATVTHQMGRKTTWPTTRMPHARSELVSRRSFSRNNPVNGV